jgi:LysM repeat protein
LPAQTAPLSAPTAPPPSDALASMEQDIQALQREVGQLNLQVQSVQQDNADLKKRILSQDELKATVENMIAASRAEIDKDITKTVGTATDDSRKDILADVAKQMEALAKDTNTQLEKLAHAIGNAPAPRPVTVMSSPSSPPPAYNGKGIDYIVKHGETLAIICRNNHVSSKEILLLNPQLNNNPNHIVEGQHLFIPQKDAPPALNLPPAAPATSGN